MDNFPKVTEHVVLYTAVQEDKDPSSIFCKEMLDNEKWKSRS